MSFTSFIDLSKVQLVITTTRREEDSGDPDTDTTYSIYDSHTINVIYKTTLKDVSIERSTALVELRDYQINGLIKIYSDITYEFAKILCSHYEEILNSFSAHKLLSANFNKNQSFTYEKDMKFYIPVIQKEVYQE